MLARAHRSAAADAGLPRRGLPVSGKLLAAVTATALLAVFAEGGASLLMSLRSARQAVRMLEEVHAEYDADLGWRHIPGRTWPDLYEPGATFTTNAQGFRGRESYSREVPAGRYRIVFAGDSFTMGFGVDDHATYPAQLEALQPAVQSVNLGQGGYGLDQIYLWYQRDGRALESQMLVVAVIAHDLYRMASERFLGYEKPVLRERDGALTVENVPVPATWSTRTRWRQAETFVRSLALARFAAWLTQPRGTAPAAGEGFYGDPGSAVFAAAAAALDTLKEQAAARGQQFVLVYLPSRDLLPAEPTRESRWLEAYGRDRGVACFNLTEEFGRLAPWELAPLFRPDFHYTVAGNRFVAEALLRRFQQTVPDFPR